MTILALVYKKLLKMQKEYDKDNIFRKIIDGLLPCDKIYEDEELLCFHDINPKAPIHMLLIPKREFISFDDFIQHTSAESIAHFFKTAREIASSQKLKSYRLVTNCGENAGQVVFHYHLHIMGYLDQ
jgi:diadenosine tetraphosphate (Ap4A) HIT family hydrolase